MPGRKPAARAGVPAPPLLGAEHAAFLRGPVAINVGSRDAAGVPSLARAFGCRVTPDRRTVTVFLPAARAQALLRDLRAGGAIAVVFSRPTTHETIQLKGAQALLSPPAPKDRALIKAYAASFGGELRRLGYRDPFASAMTAAVAEEAVGVTFTPTAAFEQTPGPAAGRPLAAKA